MAPSSGHLLVPKVLKVARFAIAKTNELIASKFPSARAVGKAVAQPAPVYARSQPTHPLAYLKQLRSQGNRLFCTQTRTFVSSATPRSAAKVDRSKFQNTHVAKTLQRSGLSPFASTLRPNLTGGTLPRSAGGYGIGGIGRARHFSHTSGCQAQVINNVSAGVRAFFVGGVKIRYDGVSPITGGARFKTVTAMQEEAYERFDRLTSKDRGTNVEFRISPTVTALSPLFDDSAATSPTTLQTPDLLSTLSGDFAHALRSLWQILGDIQRLSALGDLPIFIKNTPDGPVIGVRFPGCDADLVTRLCEDFAVTRGTVKEDAEWGNDKEVEMALLFPFAPTKAAGDGSEMHASEYFFFDDPAQIQAKQEQLNWRGDFSDSESSLLNPLESASPSKHLRSPSGYGSIEDPDAWLHSPLKTQSDTGSSHQSFEGVEGIYRFIQTCDEASWVRGS